MTEPDDDGYAERRRAAAQARALHGKAEAGGLRFEAYPPTDLATWILDKIARGVFTSPSEAVFVMLGEQQELEPHADLRQKALRRTLQAAMDDPRPGIPAEEVMRQFRRKSDEPQPELAYGRRGDGWTIPVSPSATHSGAATGNGAAPTSARGP